MFKKIKKNDKIKDRVGDYMISSGSVNKQASAITSAFKSYNSQISGLSGSWEGSSYNNLVAKAEEFASSYESTIEEQMTAFGEACDLYKDYQDAKKLKEEYQQDLENAQSAYNQAKKDKSLSIVKYSSRINKYDRLVTEMENKLKQLKKEIEAKLSSISAKLDKGSAPQKASVKGVVSDLDLSQFSGNGNLVADGDNLVLPGDLQGMVDVFGGQMDNNGAYPAGGEYCDDYARGYCLYLQTGKVAERNSVSTNGCGLQWHQISAKNRKDQAQIAYDRLVNEGKPSIIHIQSPSRKGHWVTVVGCKQGATRDSVKVDDFVIMDPANGKVRNLSEVSDYTSESGQYIYDPGFHVNYYD